MAEKRRAFEETVVPAEKTKAEIRALLMRYGAEQFGIMEEPRRALLGFVAEGRLVRIEVPLPDYRARATSKAGTYLAAGSKGALAAHAQEERRIWRATRMWIFAQLEAIASGIRTFEEAFLSDTVLPSGQRFAEWARPQIEQQVLAGRMPALLAPRERPDGDSGQAIVRVTDR